MKKKYSVFFILLAFILTISTLFGFQKGKVYAEGIIEPKSKSVYLCDANSKEVMYSYNENEKLPIASMCKIMTLLLSFESVKDNNLNLDEEITVSKNSSSMGGSQIFLEENGKYKVSELLKGIVVASANDACVAIAERLCGSEEEFVNKMNEKAKDLGMDNTCFVNCTGLPKTGQYSTAKDVSIMFSELLKCPDYYRFSTIWMDEINHPKNRKTEISNTNKLIRYYKGCDAGKTGYTSEAGYCLSASAVRNSMRLICVVINCPDSKTRFNEVSSLFNYGFSNYTNKLLVDDSKPLDFSVNIENSKNGSYSVIAENSVYLTCKKGENKNVEISFSKDEGLSAPLDMGCRIGRLSIYENGVEIAGTNVLLNEKVERKTYIDNLYEIIDNWKI